MDHILEDDPFVVLKNYRQAQQIGMKKNLQKKDRGSLWTLE